MVYIKINTRSFIRMFPKDDDGTITPLEQLMSSSMQLTFSNRGGVLAEHVPPDIGLFIFGLPLSAINETDITPPADRPSFVIPTTGISFFRDIKE